MTYRLSKLAPGSYDVILNGMIVASLVRSKVYVGPHRFRWMAELLSDLPHGARPPPFTESEHEFNTLEEACDFLGVSERPSGLKVVSLPGGFSREQWATSAASGAFTFMSMV